MTKSISVHIVIVFILLGCCLLTRINLKAQVIPLFSQTIRSQEFLNPSYNADKDYVSAIMIYRNQWQDINNSPNIMGVNIRFPVYFNPGKSFGGMGLALNVIGETLGLRNNTVTNAVIDAYLQIMDEAYLGVGITGGVEMLQYDITRIRTIEDPAIINNLSLKRIMPSLGVGILFIYKNYRFGVSTLSTVRQDMREEKPTLIPGVDIYARAVYEISKGIELMPAILVKYYSREKTHTEFNSNVLFNNRLRFGLGYRIFEAVSVMAGIKLEELFWLTYTYDYPVKGISIYGTGSHELSLSFGFNRSFYRNDRRLNEFM